ncbi:unnamed protein product [Notodromas monacha]|uniref:G-protein coupled receptors family 1 profile domain-containing protein n=1 Tax=Notodromas monacha TaxID=399045 RepID=A0A7R9G8X8_9CRUS|nr:unnamed protein product [Notodromas monacha]CAG0912244.1 unnamed protein product [Notodromas monacha]
MTRPQVNHQAWDLDDFLCDLYIAMDVTCSTSSILNLVAISIDRTFVRTLVYAEFRTFEAPLRRIEKTISGWNAGWTCEQKFHNRSTGVCLLFPFSSNILAGDAMVPCGARAFQYRTPSGDGKCDESCPMRRYIAVTRPIKYAKHKNNSRVALTIVLVWAISAAIGIPIVTGLNNTPDRDHSICAFFNSDFIIYSSLSSFYIPCIIMVVLYFRIFKVSVSSPPQRCFEQ